MTISAALLSGCVFIVKFDTGRNATAVIDHGYGIIRVQRDVDLCTETGKGFIDRVIQHFKNQMMQTGTIRRIADIHPGPFRTASRPSRI